MSDLAHRLARAEEAWKRVGDGADAAEREDRGIDFAIEVLEVLRIARREPAPDWEQIDGLVYDMCEVIKEVISPALASAAMADPKTSK